MRRFYSTLRSIPNAKSAFEKSCYHKIDFKINEKEMVYNAVQRFSAYDIGCLAVTNDHDRIVGVINERDYINKVALLGRSSKSTPVSEICKYEPNVCTALTTDDIHVCMNKMMDRNVRHLLVFEQEKNEIVGIISIRDLIKEVLLEKDKVIKALSNLNTGRGGHFEHT